MAQTWRDLLFAHWPVSWDVLRPLVPEAMDLDRWDGAAWLGVVPFRMTGIRARATVALPHLSETLELNVRTYVTVNGKPGVYFFSLDAESPLAVRVARRFFHLPYFDATMHCRLEGGDFVYSSRRTHRRAKPAALEIAYRPTGPAVRSREQTLEHFLTERYCLYTTDPAGALLRGDIQHEPWPLQPAAAEIASNSMAGPLGIALEGSAPVLHFAKLLSVKIWGLARC
ncbi:MAG: hypothetical protein JWO80_1114 [Bryobacterales bacterium]|nr:hypothetical protein [Bryobacterales bacterium]